ENLTVNVDARAHAFRERLELDVRINDDLILQAHARSLNIRDQDDCEVHNLEFGLAFPVAHGREERDDEGAAAEDGQAADRGALSIRANVANRDDLALVPGEFLYIYNPGYFDRRSDPPEYQSEERLYYAPCSVCGCASNDPRCTCSRLLPDPATQAAEL